MTEIMSTSGNNINVCRLPELNTTHSHLSKCGNTDNYSPYKPHIIYTFNLNLINFNKFINDNEILQFDDSSNFPKKYIDYKCSECHNENAQTKLCKPLTKQDGYYCDKCLEDIQLMDNLYRSQPKQFWAMYPEHSNEYNKTF